MIFLCQIDQWVEYIFTALLGIKSRISLTYQQCAINAFLKETKRSQTYRLKVTSLCWQDPHHNFILLVFLAILKQTLIEGFALLFQIFELKLLNFITSFICKKLEETLVKFFDNWL